MLAKTGPNQANQAGCCCSSGGQTAAQGTLLAALCRRCKFVSNWEPLLLPAHTNIVSSISGNISSISSSINKSTSVSEKKKEKEREQMIRNEANKKKKKCFTGKQGTVCLFVSICFL